jgi:hypothetical protein
VKVEPGGNAGLPDAPDNLTLADAFAGFDVEILQMTVSGPQTVAMIDAHIVPIPALAPGNGYVR